MLKVTMLIPLQDNNNVPIDPNKIGRHLHDILELCGGYTRSEPTLTGVWKNEEGRVFFDSLFSVVVCCEDNLLPGLRIIAGEIAKTCRQECIYFESHAINLEFIKPCE